MTATARASTSAFYRCEVRPLSRSEGHHATAASAYRTADKLHDERTGLTFDYRRRRGVEFAAVVRPNDADWIVDRQTLWNAAEKMEKRSNSRVARDCIVAFPHELTKAERERCSRDMAKWLCDRYQVAVDVAVHRPHRNGDDRNWHAHLLFTTRRITATGVGEKTRELDDKVTGGQEIERIRAAWAETINRALERQCLDIRADHRSNKARGINRIPQVKLGRAVITLEQRGITTEVGDRYREIAAANANIARLEERQEAIEAEIAALEAELAVEQQNTPRAKFVENAPGSPLEHIQPKKRTNTAARSPISSRGQENAMGVAVSARHADAIQGFAATWTALEPLYPTDTRRDWHSCRMLRQAGFAAGDIRAALHYHVVQREQSKRSPQQLVGYVNRTVEKVMALPQAQLAMPYKASERSPESASALTPQQREDSLISFRAAWTELEPTYKTTTRTDWHTCRLMAEAGFSAAEIRYALQQSSPQARGRQPRQSNAYVDRTVTKVMELPSVQQSRAELARQAAERDQRKDIQQQMHPRQPEPEHLSPVHAKGEKEQVALNVMLAYQFPDQPLPQEKQRPVREDGHER